MDAHVPVSVLLAFTLLLHGGLAGAAHSMALFSEIGAWNRMLRETVTFRLAQSYDIEVDKEPPPPEEKEEEPPPEPPKPEVKEEAPPPTDEPPPPPAAAEAAKVIATEPDPNEPVDMRDTIVQGNAETYAGGTTQAGGTSKVAVRSTAAVATGTPGGTGTAPAPAAPRVDRSRAAGLLGSSDWADCPFPPEADAEQIDDAYVTIQVSVRPDGAPQSVRVVQDPGHGFGREARKCAMRKHFSFALDVEGRPIPGTTKPFRVHFER